MTETLRERFRDVLEKVPPLALDCLDDGAVSGFQPTSLPTAHFENAQQSAVATTTTTPERRSKGKFGTIIVSAIVIFFVLIAMYLCWDGGRDGSSRATSRSPSPIRTVAPPPAVAKVETVEIEAVEGSGPPTVTNGPPSATAALVRPIPRRATQDAVAETDKPTVKEDPLFQPLQRELRHKTPN